MDGLINIQNFEPNLLNIEKKSFKNIDTYYIGYIAIKDSEYLKTNSVNPFYLTIDKVDGYIKEENADKYLTLVFTDKNKEVLTKYTKI